MLGRSLAVAHFFLLVYRRTWRGSLVGRFLSPLFYLGAMGIGLGTLVDRGTGGVGGLSYLHYVVPAMVATQAMVTAVAESAYPVMAHIRWTRMYHAMLSTPIGIGEVLAGHLLVVGAQVAVGTAVFVLVAGLLGGFASAWAALCVPLGVLTGMAFALPVFAFTATQHRDTGLNVLFRLVVTPLMLFSGTFFPITTLPAWVQGLAWATPLWHGVELCRASATAGAPGGVPLGAGTASAHLVVLLGYLVVGAVAARATFRRRLLT